MTLEREVYKSKPTIVEPPKTFKPLTELRKIGSVRLGLDDSFILDEMISNKEYGSTLPQRWGRIVALGLRAQEDRRAKERLIQEIREARRLLTALSHLDFEPHPQPKGIDPIYWCEQEQERIRTLGHQAKQGIEAALRALEGKP